MRNNFIYLLGMVVLMMSNYHCKSDYEEMVSSELAKDVRSDSLIFGMSIGQTKKDFFETCWNLNKEKLISQGTGNLYAKYIEPYDSINPDPFRKEMQFYGIFDKNDIMRGMDIIYTYTAWSPWDSKYHADSLIVELKEDLLQDYDGNEFIQIQLPEINKSAFVKIDGNRRILLYPKSKNQVALKFEDIKFKLAQ